MWADGLTHEESGRAAIIQKMIQKYYPEITSMPNVKADNGLSVADLIDVDLTDAKWQQLVEQCSYEEMIRVISNGFHQTAPVASINLPGTLDENGPQGFTKSLIGGSSAMCYTSEDVMAATYNLDLLNDMGKCIGEDFFHATKNDADTFYTGLYGPGANIHRTPYSGRNFEYYSEDGFVSGKMAASEVKGIQSKGVYVFTKHFALNDQEEGRYGISTWSNEQANENVVLEMKDEANGATLTFNKDKSYKINMAFGSYGSFDVQKGTWAFANYKVTLTPESGTAYESKVEGGKFIVETHITWGGGQVDKDVHFEDSQTVIGKFMASGITLMK